MTHTKWPFNRTNFDLLNNYNIDAADIVDAKAETLPEYGDDVKVKELNSTKSSHIENFVFLFNFTKGNYIRITNIADKHGEIVSRVARLIIPSDILDVYGQILGEMANRN